MEKKGFFADVYHILMQVPAGKVTTYGAIARAAGRPRLSRFVGYALHTNPQPGIIPCHRVVNRQGLLSGAFAFGGIDVQKTLLQNEGVFVDDQNKVDLEKFGFWV